LVANNRNEVWLTLEEKEFIKGASDSSQKFPGALDKLGGYEAEQ
jgi:hypothetical protein